MKRLFATFTILLALPLVFAGSVAASGHFWQVEMSDPTTSDQRQTFNIEFTALSVEPSDEITVNLLQNGATIDSITTPGGGGSGAFEVAVEEDGIYSYWIASTSSIDSSTQNNQAEARNVRVVTPPDQETVIVVDPELTPEEEQTLIDQTQGAETGDAGDVAGATDAEETNADEDIDGTVSDEAATDTEEDGEVLGAEDEADEGLSIISWIIAAGALLGVLYYFFVYRSVNAE